MFKLKWYELGNEKKCYFKNHLNYLDPCAIGSKRIIFKALKHITFQKTFSNF
jgi:hypothetical protein